MMNVLKKLSLLLLITANFLSVNAVNNFPPGECANADSQVFYKEINPKITTQPPTGIDKWSVPKVSSMGTKIPLTNGAYHIGNISFKINDVEHFDPTKQVTITATCNGEIDEVPCVISETQRKPWRTQPECFQDLFRETFIKGTWLETTIVLTAELQDTSGKVFAIKLESKHELKKPLTIQGMSVIFNEVETKIYLDFIDTTAEQLPINYFEPIYTCKHKKPVLDKKVFFIKDHELRECNAKDILHYFDSPEARRKWLLDETGFFDLKTQQPVTSLPKYHKHRHQRLEPHTEPLVWFFGEDKKHDSFYEFEGDKTLIDNNEFLYSTGGSLQATLQCKQTAKEYLTDQNKIACHYLKIAPTPSLMVDSSITTEKAHKLWLKGVYHKTQNNDRILWERIEDQENEIEYFIHDNELGKNFGLVENWANAPQDIPTQETELWCEAAHRFFDHYSVRANNCNQAILDKLTTWNKIISLDMSNLKKNGKAICCTGCLEDILTIISSMQQLTCLKFCNNSPITNFNQDYDTLASRSCSFFFAMARCLRNLTKLEELHIQGLWLRPHTVLGNGVTGNAPYLSIDVSSQVAKLTSIINHIVCRRCYSDCPRSVNAIINSVCDLTKLKKLSIDGIPASGFSYAARHDGVGCFLRNCFGVGTTIDAIEQDNYLSWLVNFSATELTKIPLLTTINVYSPGGNCVDYYSNIFREKLAASKPAGSQLEITAEVLS